MQNNLKSFLYRFDFIGLVPQFRILNNNRYKSIFSSLISIIIIIVSLSLAFYTSIYFIKYSNPTI